MYGVLIIYAHESTASGGVEEMDKITLKSISTQIVTQRISKKTQAADLRFPYTKRPLTMDPPSYANCCDENVYGERE